MYTGHKDVDKKREAFFALVRVGLWEQDTQLLPVDGINYSEIYQLAEEQSVVGLIAAGIEHVKNVKVPHEIALNFGGTALQLEQQNIAMNKFIACLIGKLREVDTYTLLVKGQGIAQCYERPLWRTCGDVDFLLSKDNYNKAKKILLPLATATEEEYKHEQHFGMTIDNWGVELHGSLRCGLSRRIDKALDEIQNDIFFGGSVRSWMNDKTQVFMPGINEDIVFVFTHFLQHFYKGGLGIRQICDWCRLLWTYKDTLNHEQLESRIRKMGLMKEWKAFGVFAVDYLGMPSETMPMYAPDDKWKRKADKICDFIMEVGNMGYNRDISYFEKYPYLIRKVCSMGRRCGDVIRHVQIFPLDSLRFFPYIMFNGIRSAIRGE